MVQNYSAATVFVTASVAIVDAGRLLVVRKRGTEMFMLVGGKLEPGESTLAAALREAEEEVGLVLRPEEIEVLGHWQAPAANEPGAVVDSVVHVVERPVDVVARAEIEELAWVPIAAGQPSGQGPGIERLAPLTIDHVLPALREWLAVGG